MNNFPVIILKMLIWLCGIFGMLPLMAQTSNVTDKEEFDEAMHYAEKKFNAQMSGVKIDSMTTIRFAVYSENASLFGYHYLVDYFKTTGLKKLSKKHFDEVKNFNTNKTCSTEWIITFMKQFNLKVSHSFTDAETGVSLAKIIVTPKDCAITTIN